MNKIETGKRRVSTSNGNSKIIGRVLVVLLMAGLLIAFISVVTIIVGLLVGSGEDAPTNSGVLVGSVLEGTENDNLAYVTAERIITGPVVEPAEPAAQEISIEGDAIEIYEGTAIVGNKAYSFYKFDNAKADSFVSAVNSSISKIDEEVNISTMIIPSAVDIMLPLSFLNQYTDETSDQDKTIEYLNKGIDSRAKKLNIYPYLKAHCDEKLYFYSDNRWTSLAAFYAYDVWAMTTGIERPVLSEYKENFEDGFLGALYSFYGLSAISTPETIEYYVPTAHLTMGEEDESVFADVSELSSSEKYNVFLGGNRDITEIENQVRSDGATCVVVGDSFSNALVPYIAQNYQYTYFIDYRYYDGDLAAFVSEKEATELVYAFSITATNTDSLISEID